MTGKRSTLSRRRLIAACAAALLVASAGCGGVDRDPAPRPTPFQRQQPAIEPAATPVATGQISATVGSFTFTPVNARFRQDQPGLSAVEITLDVTADPSVPVATLRWGPRLEFTEINLTPVRHSPSGDELKLVARISWGRSNFVDLRPEPAVTRLNYSIVGGTTRSFVTGFGARIPTSVADNLTFTLLDGAVAEHQAGQAEVVASFPLPARGDHPAQRLLETRSNGVLAIGPAFTISCAGRLATLNGVLANPTVRPVVVGLMELTLYDENGLPVGEWPINRFGQQTEGGNLNRSSDEPLQAGEDVTFEFEIPVATDTCDTARYWAILHTGRLLEAGELE